MSFGQIGWVFHFISKPKYSDIKMDTMNTKFEKEVVNLDFTRETGMCAS